MRDDPALPLLLLAVGMCVGSTTTWSAWITGGQTGGTFAALVHAAIVVGVSSYVRSRE